MKALRDPSLYHFETRVAGVGYPNDDGEERQDILAELSEQRGAEVSFYTEPHNPHDANAVAVWMDGKQVGYLEKDLAARLQPYLQAGYQLVILGCRIVPSRYSDYEVDLELGLR